MTWAKERGSAVEEFLPNRTSPIGYLFDLKPLKRSLYVLGAYETPTGGCDTIHDVSQLFELVMAQYKKKRHVLYEGLFVMNMTRGPQLAAQVGRELCVLQLTTPLATCMTSINARRAERGEDVLITKKNTEGNYRRAINYCAKMRDAGARVIRITRDEGLDQILSLLKED